MRFCLVSTQSNWGGGEALVWSIGQELQSLGHQVAWMAREDGGLADRIRKHRATALHFHRGKGRSPADWWATVSAIRQWSPDVMIANDTHAVHLVGSACWFCRQPTPLRLAYKHTIFPLRSRLKYLVLTDRIVCVSAAAQQVVERGGVPSSRTAVIYGGCDLPPRIPGAREEVFNELKLPATTKLLVSVGNLLECKGHVDLIEAVAQLLPTHPDLVLLIAGEGAERQRLLKRIENCGLTRHARLLGYRDDVARLIAAADLVVHPSHSEGLSLVLIQAQMLAKPIVATAVGGTVEVLAANDPQACTAWLAEPQNPGNLAHQIGLALKSLQSSQVGFEQQLQATADRMVKTFGLRSNTQQLVELVQHSRAYG